MYCSFMMVAVYEYLTTLVYHPYNNMDAMLQGFHCTCCEMRGEMCGEMNALSNRAGYVCGDCSLCIP